MTGPRWSALLLCLLGACSVTVDPLGRPCNEVTRCGPGTVCDPVSHTCVKAVPDRGVPDAPADMTGPGREGLATEARAQDQRTDGRRDQRAPDAVKPVDLPRPAEPGSCAATCSGCCVSTVCIPFASQSASNCGKGGAACKSCDDGLSCTSDSCSSGSCSNPIQAGNCLITGVCYANTAVNPADACQKCVASSPTVWSTGGACVITIAGSGGVGMDDGPALSATFDEPRGIAVDTTGKVYVADLFNNAVRTVSAGTVSTLAGTGDPGLVNGPAASAKFSYPTDVLVSGGAVYVADRNNHLIRRISGGQVTTFAGIGTPGLVDGDASSTAQFNIPIGLAIGPGGVIYIADSANHAVRTLSGSVVGTLAGEATAPA
jgi:hypothetical protein